MSEIFLINETPNLFRWISVVENENDWGLRIAQLRGQAAPNFGPVDVKWTTETLSREIADFAYFRSNLKCMNLRTSRKLADYLKDCGEWIRLSGLDYIAFYCRNIIDAVNEEETTALQIANSVPSFHSPLFAPVLELDKLMKVNIFRVPQSISKIFVSREFKETYEVLRLRGLDFIPVSVV